MGSGIETLEMQGDTGHLESIAQAICRQGSVAGVRSLFSDSCLICNSPIVFSVSIIVWFF